MTEDNRYLLITYDAVKSITGNRFFQSKEFPQAIKLCSFLKNESKAWRDNNIMAARAKSGYVILTDKPDKKRGVLFDLKTFHGFEEESDENIINIFSKTLRYAVRYFDKHPLIRCEKEIPNSQISVIYPFPFAAANNVTKVVIDRNSNKQDRKECNYLTVYYYGNDDNQVVSHQTQNKMLKELPDVAYIPQEIAQNSGRYVYPVTDLQCLPLCIDSAIGLDNWLQYLTEPQKNFIENPLNGAERLEGAAGTGKTLTLVLRCIYLLREAHKNDSECRLIFFTHSNSTKDRIEDIFRRNWDDFDDFNESGGIFTRQSILITTLQEWSIRHLGINRLEENEYLDKDAEDSKLLQLMYIEQAFDNFKHSFHNLYEIRLSKDFKTFLNGESKSYIIDTLQREISEVIKGQCNSNESSYRSCERPSYGLKLNNEFDRRYVFGIFNEYQKSLEDIGQYDSDDIVITALGQVDSPIWNRRRSSEGYDACFIDETHLFNLNELSLFHHVNKTANRNRIIYAIDRSQAIGDNNTPAQDSFDKNNGPHSVEQYKTVFRSSPEIAILAYDILSSGARLFTTLENPLQQSTFTFTSQDESKCRFPEYFEVAYEDHMYSDALNWCESYISQTGCQKSSICIICPDMDLMEGLKKYAVSTNKPHMVLKSRSDNSNLKKAKEWNKFVFSHIDYVGGLEFDAVVTLGAEKERMPPLSSESSIHIANYAWFNRLYVAVSRAKYAVCFFGLQSRGISPLLQGAIQNESLHIANN